MIRMIIGGRTNLVNSVLSKKVTKCFRKNLGCKTAKVNCKDIVVDTIDDNTVLVHFTGDFILNKDEILALMNNKMEVPE